MPYQRLMLPGPRGSLAATRSPMPLLLTISVLAGLVVAGFVFTRSASRPRMSATESRPVPVASPVPDGVLEDLEVHMRNSRESAASAAENIKKAQRLLKSIRPDLDRNYMELARRRSETADVSLSHALESVQKVLDELAVAGRHAQEER